MSPEIEQAAADWIARRYKGLSAAESDDFQCWLAADVRHAAVFEELDETWRTLDRVRSLGIADRTPNPDALAPRPRRPARLGWAPVLAAAAAVAVGYFGFHGGSFHFSGGEVRTTAPEAGFFSEVVTTAVGGLRKLMLPDGSVVQLNTDTQVRVRYTTGERRLSIVRGEAHFSVAKNPARPFFVEAGPVTVRAVGTAFNVRLRAADIEVLVTEGRVRVDDGHRGEPMIASRVPGETPLLGAGERVVVPLANAESGRAPMPVVPVTPAEIERMLAWQDRRLEFVAAPLDEIVAEFNRYNRHQLVVGERSLGRHRFGGSFRVAEPETFGRLLETRFGVVLERRENETILLRAP